MHVQAVKSKRNGKTYITYLVKESFRTPKGPRSRTVCNISGLPEQIRDMVRFALKGKSLVAEESIRLEQAVDFGGIAVLKDAWERFGGDGAIGFIRDKRAVGLIKAMIFARILFPGSKLSLAHKAEQTALAQACGLPADEIFDEDELYEAMDRLNGNWSEIESQLYKCQSQPSATIALYDLTSIYFEGKGPKHLAHYGYSRDHRNDRKQVLLAVATDRQGQPIHIEVLKGNRGDNSTLLGLLQMLRRRHGITQATFVFDGGMSSRFNLEAMDAASLNFVTRLGSESLKSLVSELPEDNQPELWDRDDLLEIILEGKRYVIAGSSYRAERDRQRRHSRIEKATQELVRLQNVRRKKFDVQKLSSQVGRALQRLKAHKYFDYKVQDDGKIQWSLKAQVIQKEAAIDGLYLLYTNLDYTHNKTTVHQHYKNLISVENAFRELKSYLKVRPVFHYRPDRVRNHIRICFLAYWLSARLSVQWQQVDISTEVTSIVRRLQTIRIGNISLGNKFTTMMTQIPKSLNELINQLGITHLFNSPPIWICSQ